jgi:hypothetical protein
MITNAERNILFSREYGRNRREYIIRHLRVHGKLVVNKEHQLQTKQDKDLQWLMKKGIIKISRERTYAIFKSEYATKRTTCSQSYVVLV